MRKIMTVNFMSHVKLAKLLLPSMLERRAGHVINTSSVTGRIGVVHRTAYCASKHAIVGYFDALRFELAGSGIFVTNACPGPTQVEPAVKKE